MGRKSFRIAMLVAFVVFASVSAYFVGKIHFKIGETILSTSGGVPIAWRDLPNSLDVAVDLSAETQDTVVLYTASIRNTGASTIYLKNLASFIDEADGPRDGFLPLGGNTAEFAYVKDDSSAWSNLELSAPKNGLNGFRLANSLAIGPSGSNNDTLYVRFQVSPSLDYDVISDKLVVLLDDGRGNNSVATTSNSVAVNIESNDFVVAANTSSTDPYAIFDALTTGEIVEPTTVAVNDETGESAFAQPLGVVSEITDLKTIATVSTSDDSVDESFMSTTALILVGVLAVFAVAFIGYIIVVKY